MSEQFLLYRQLKPLQTLELLTRVAEKQRALPRDALTFSFENEQSITVCLRYDGNVEARTFRELWRKVYLNPEYSTQARPDKFMPLRQAAPLWMLTTPAPGSSVANPFGREYLLVGHAMDGDEFECAAKLVRVANIAVQVARTVEQGKPIALFFLKAMGKGDEDLLLKELNQYPLLRAFKSSNGGIVFLPPAQKVDQTYLDAFTELARAAPEIWDGKSAAPSSNLLFAMDVRQDDSLLTDVRVWYLAPLQFVKPEWQQVDVKVYALQNNARETEALLTRIRESKPPWGYPLELHRMERQTPAQAAYDVTRVRRRINELQALATYLEAIQVERPRLYRFTQKQLPALANVLANFPPRVLADRKLLYGFESNAHHAQGLHYLYLAPGIEPMARPDPTPLWTHLENCDMRFWLDPYWAKEYYDKLPAPERRAPKYLVFVPEWTALYPAFHDWDAEAIGKCSFDFLRESAAQWARASAAHEANPQRRADLEKLQVPAGPFYIFDGSAEPTVQVSVLDATKFQPLQMRLDWLNQNLYLHTELGNEAIIQKLAEHKLHADLAREFDSPAQAAEASFRAHADATKSAIAQTTTQMVNQVSAGLDDVTAVTTKALADIRALNARLQDVQKKYTDLKGAPDQVEKGFQDVRAYLEKLQAALETLQSETDTKMLQAATERDIAERKVDIFLEQLKSDMRAIRRRLGELW